MIKIILFDFDGTIADTFVALEKILVRLSPKFGYEIPTKKDMAILQTIHPKEVMKLLGVSYFKLPFIAHKAKAELRKEMTTIKPIEGMRDVLLALKRENYILGILTSNSKANVRTFLEKNDIAIFDWIYSERSLFGKARKLKKIIRKQKLDKKEVIYIGDEIRDIEAAKKSQIKIMAVSWGFNTVEGLEKYHPDFLLTEPKDILTSLESFRFLS